MTNNIHYDNLSIISSHNEKCFKKKKVLEKIKAYIL